MSDRKQDDDDIDDIDDALDDGSDGHDSEHVIVRATPSLDSEARRKLEDALEERRLRKQIQDYDFDFD